MLQIYNDRKVTGDFTLESKDGKHQVRVHLFVLIGRSDYFRAMIDSPMLEGQNMKSSYDVPVDMSRAQFIFEAFVRYLYIDELKFGSD